MFGTILLGAAVFAVATGGFQALLKLVAYAAACVAVVALFVFFLGVIYVDLVATLWRGVAATL